ncbi:ABC transporter substrate-binding protein [Corynebacterium urogenitale]
MKKSPLVAVLLTSSLTLAGCSEGGTGAGAHGATIDNCGAQVTVPADPQKVMTLGAESITTLAHLGVLDRVASRAGQYPREYFDEATNDALDKVPSLTDRLDSSGHLLINMEQVAAQEPDLVIGATDTVTRQALDPLGIPQLDEPAFCGSLEGAASWEDAWDHVMLYATAFGKQPEGEKYVEELKGRLGKMDKGNGGDSRPSVLVTYPSLGGGPMYAYGTHSMSHPVVESAGLRNVFADTPERVFEVSPEQVAQRNPDIIIALYTAGDPDTAKQAVLDYEAAKDTPAVKEGRVLPLLLNYAEPPTPLAVEGVEKIRQFAMDTANSTSTAHTGDAMNTEATP